jgi:RNA polymerase sigma factor (sigma-70 family)
LAVTQHGIGCRAKNLSKSWTRGAKVTHYMTRGEGEHMATALRMVLQQLQQGGEGLTDGQLLGRFVAARDEAAFAALVRRHGPMVLGVCTRVLRDCHDAEDAFQATFLVLARQAGSVLKREAVGSWLYGTAYRTSLEARELSARRRARERPMRDMPHPEVMPVEAKDWRPLLDRELNLLPGKYRAAIVVCDLEGRTRKEAARRLGINEGTLSSRLARGHALLAKRLARCGVALSAGALAAVLVQGGASASMPAALVSSTSKAAVLVAAGQMVGATPAVLLMKGVMKAMLLKKLRLAVGAVMVLAALGAVGFGYRAGGGPGTVQAAPPDKPRSELEALRRENELLKLNLEVVLEKVRAQEGALRDLRGQVAQLGKAGAGRGVTIADFDGDGLIDIVVANTRAAPRDSLSDAAKEAESALKALREAKDKAGQRRATESLEKALQKLKQLHDGRDEKHKQKPDAQERPW